MRKTTMAKLDFKMLHELIDIEAVSGNEGPVPRLHTRKNETICGCYFRGQNGRFNLPQGRKPSIMLAAHMDEMDSWSNEWNTREECM